MNAVLEHTAYKYLCSIDEPFSLTDIARRFVLENPSYMIQSWLRSRNTIEFLGKLERNNSKQFDEEAFQKLLKDGRSPSSVLDSKGMEATLNAIGFEFRRGKKGGTMAHAFIACDSRKGRNRVFCQENQKRSSVWVQHLCKVITPKKSLPLKHP